MFKSSNHTAKIPFVPSLCLFDLSVCPSKFDQIHIDRPDFLCSMQSDSHLSFFITIADLPSLCNLFALGFNEYDLTKYLSL